MTTEAFLIRDAGDGFAVTLDWPERERVKIAVLAANGTVVLDEFEVPCEEGLDALNHTAMYSKRYAEALR